MRAKSKISVPPLDFENLDKTYGDAISVCQSDLYQSAYRLVQNVEVAQDILQCALMLGLSFLRTRSRQEIDALNPGLLGFFRQQVKWAAKSYFRERDEDKERLPTVSLEQTSEEVTFLWILFVFLSDNFFRGLLQTA